MTIDCDIIVVGGSVFVDFVRCPYLWIYVSTNIYQSSDSYYILIQQTSYLRQYDPTNLQTFGNPQTLAPS